MPLMALPHAQALHDSSREADPRGWPVYTLIDAAPAGIVAELLAFGDVVRYLAVRQDEHDGDILVPVGMARADEITRRVWLPGMHRRLLRGLPRHRVAEPPDRAEERSLVAACRKLISGGAGVLGQAELSSLTEMEDYRVPHEEADPRGWPVIDATGARAATVADLLVDTVALKVRYMVCDVEAGDGSARALLPAGFTRLHEDEREVHLPGIMAAVLAELPRFHGDPPDAAFEAELLAVLDGAAEDRSFYHDPIFEPAECFGRRLPA